MRLPSSPWLLKDTYHYHLGRVGLGEVSWLFIIITCQILPGPGKRWRLTVILLSLFVHFLTAQPMSLACGHHHHHHPPRLNQPFSTDTQHLSTSSNQGPVALRDPPRCVLQLQPAGDSWTEQDTGALEHAIRCCQTGVRDGAVCDQMVIIINVIYIYI